MRGLFCTDLHIYRDINGNYCSTTLTNDLFSRYYTVVDQLTVATRIEQINISYFEAHCEKIDLKGLNIIEVPNLMSPKNFFSLRLNAMEILNEAVKKSDLVFIRGGETGNIVGNICIKNKKPYIFEISGCAWDSFWNHGLDGKLIAPYMEIMVKKLARNASYVIYVTDKWLQKRYPCKCEFVNASNVYLSEMDDEVWVKRSKKIIAKREDDLIIIGTTAAVNVKYKGQEYVIKAIAKLKKNGYKIKYELVGSGNQEYLLSIAKRYKVEEIIDFKGTLTNQEVLKWLDNIDIYAQPSKQEGLPRALVEAMSRGCLAIGSKTAGIPELIDKCYIFNKGKVVQIYKIIKSLVDEKDKNKKLEIAHSNFLKAKKYEINVLNKKREYIYNKYYKLVNKKDF